MKSQIKHLLTSGLTIFLAWKNQYFYALCGACLTLAAATTPWQWTELCLYFHANWHGENELKTRPRVDWK